MNEYISKSNTKTVFIIYYYCLLKIHSSTLFVQRIMTIFNVFQLECKYSFKLSAFFRTIMSHRWRTEYVFFSDICKEEFLSWVKSQACRDDVEHRQPIWIFGFDCYGKQYLNIYEYSNINLNDNKYSNTSKYSNIYEYSNID